MRRLSPPTAFFLITAIIVLTLSLALSFLLSGEGASTAQKFEIFPPALPFVLFFAVIGELIIGLPVLSFLRARHLYGNLLLLVGLGLLGGCLYVVLITLTMAGDVPTSPGDIRFFFGAGGGLGALSGALWWLVAERRGQEDR